MNVDTIESEPKAQLHLGCLFISPGHNYLGHHGQPADVHEVIEVPEVRCVAGRGIEGDRYFDHRPGFKGQITFFAEEVYEALCRDLGVKDRPASVLRRPRWNRARLGSR